MVDSICPGGRPQQQRLCRGVVSVAGVREQENRGNRNVCRGVASVAGVREQEKRVNRDVDLAVLEEPGGFLSSEASWEMR